MTADVVFAGNRMANPDATKAGHLNADAGGHNGGIMPGWHFQCLDNRLVRGTTWIGCNGRPPTTKRARAAGLDFDWYTGPVMSGCTLRGNRAEPAEAAGSYINLGSSHPGVGPVRDVIIEGCEVPAIQVEKGNHDILIRNNYWKAGVPEYRGPGINGKDVRVVPQPDAASAR
jgi:hypothetical protein